MEEPRVEKSILLISKIKCGNHFFLGSCGNGSYYVGYNKFVRVVFTVKTNDWLHTKQITYVRYT